MDEQPRGSALQRAVHGWRPAARRSAGFGLIEVLVMIMIVSTVILAIMAGLLTAVKSSGIVAAKRDLAGSLTIATEKLQADSTSYQQCGAGTVNYPTPSSYVPDFPAVDFSVTVSFFNGSQYQATCPGTDQGAQLLTVTATRSGQSETATVVKRDPSHCEGC